MSTNILLCMSWFTKRARPGTPPLRVLFVIYALLFRLTPSAALHNSLSPDALSAHTSPSLPSSVNIMLFPYDIPSTVLCCCIRLARYPSFLLSRASLFSCMTTWTPFVCAQEWMLMKKRMARERRMNERTSGG